MVKEVVVLTTIAGDLQNRRKDDIGGYPFIGIYTHVVESISSSRVKGPWIPEVFEKSKRLTSGKLCAASGGSAIAIRTVGSYAARDAFTVPWEEKLLSLSRMKC
jgi:hypothetical protein